MADSRDQVDYWSTTTSEQDVGEKRLLAQFKSEDGELVATPFDLPIDVTQEGLQLLCNAALQNVSSSARGGRLGSPERNVPLIVHPFASFHVSSVYLSFNKSTPT